MQGHSYTERYRAVWDVTLAGGELSDMQVAKSQYYFEDDLSRPTPKEFDTFGMVALMPMPEETQAIFTNLWDDVMQSLDRPVAYTVEPPNRHIELILFSRPEEPFPVATILNNVETSFKALQSSPPKPFKIMFSHPFITPDGTVVVPGFPSPETAIDEIRARVREATDAQIPERQSQWLHVSLGRILEPLDADRCTAALQELEDNWGRAVAELEVSELLWTHEKQWYMLKKTFFIKLFCRREYVIHDEQGQRRGGSIATCDCITVK